MSADKTETAPVHAVVTRPRRHQRSRRKGSRLPDGVVCVTRPGKWGNPFETAGEFRSSLEAILGISGQSEFHSVNLQQFAHVNAIARNLHELRGKDLACWCGFDHECHADVLIELANR